jgi:SET domain-containing protein
MKLPVIIKKSEIHGKGVFANRNFKKGQIIIRWDISRQLTKDQVKKLPKKDKEYIAYVHKKYILMQSPAKYVNHSCDSNTYSKNFKDIAKRNIKKGEEITGDYSQDADEDFKMKCKCQSAKCKKIIVIK